MTVALIDADSIYYILAHQFRDRLTNDDDPNQMMSQISDELRMEMYGAVDQFVIGILQACGAAHYLGAIGDKQRCFRHDIAKFKPYKGSRPESPPWFTLWKPVIEQRFREEWGFVSVPGLEADDIISAMQECHNVQRPGFLPSYTIICSPDKDLRQFSGRFFDYKKLDFFDVNQDEADYNLAFQMIAGDSGDSVAGIPGAGEKKAKEKLKECKGAEMFYDQMVRSMYYKHFGNYYGNIIYLEHHALLSMVTSKHPFYDDYKDQLSALRLRPVPTTAAGEATLDKLKQLGWG